MAVKMKNKTLVILILSFYVMELWPPRHVYTYLKLFFFRVYSNEFQTCIFYLPHEVHAECDMGGLKTFKQSWIQRSFLRRGNIQLWYWFSKTNFYITFYWFHKWVFHIMEFPPKCYQVGIFISFLLMKNSAQECYISYLVSHSQ